MQKPIPCGCKLYGFQIGATIGYCSMHAKAGEMKTALQRIVDRWEKGDLAEAVREGTVILKAVEL